MISRKRLAFVAGKLPHILLCNAALRVRGTR
jgi:hypothetical protein